MPTESDIEYILDKVNDYYHRYKYDVNGKKKTIKKISLLKLDNKQISIKKAKLLYKNKKYDDDNGY